MSRITPRPASRACSESQALIDESATLISGAGEAIAMHLDQIARSKKLIEKSRKQIADYRDK
ncbi:MAG: hypothetical protein R3D62_06650 [Xanthobacteraceae bacterium]